MRRDVEQMKQAFAYHVVQQILAADDHVARGEVRFLEERFPRETMVQVGLMDEEGVFTDRFPDAYTEALRRLPAALGRDEKLALITLFLDACVADGALDSNEGRVLLDAADRLGVTPHELNAHLDTLAMVGEVELGLPEPV